MSLNESGTVVISVDLERSRDFLVITRLAPLSLRTLGSSKQRPSVRHVGSGVDRYRKLSE